MKEMKEKTMSEEIKVGDWFKIEDNDDTLYKAQSIEDGYAICGNVEVELICCKKVYVSDTPPPQSVKGGHMAGYGRVNHFEYLPLRAYGDKGNYLAEQVTYPELGLVFCRHPDDEWEQVEGLPHEQDDLKHLFE